MSGRGLLVLYDLIHLRGEPCSAAQINSRADSLRDHLKDWVENSIPGSLAPEYLIYKLSHTYGDDELSLDTLEGKDSLRARYLKNACDKTDLYFYIAGVCWFVSGMIDEDEVQEYTDYVSGDRYVRRGGYGHDGHYEREDEEDADSVDSSTLRSIEKILEDSFELTTIYDANGAKLPTTLTLRKEWLIQRTFIDREVELDHVDTVEVHHCHQRTVSSPLIYIKHSNPLPSHIRS
jgi:hypothetical protein